jgi:hypothetical protein
MLLIFKGCHIVEQNNRCQFCTKTEDWRLKMAGCKPVKRYRQMIKMKEKGRGIEKPTKMDGGFSLWNNSYGLRKI